MQARAAIVADAAAIATIYNQGIEDRTATFETDPRRPEDIAARSILTISARNIR